MAELKPRTQRRWFRFSLRTLALVIVVMSIPLAWVSQHLERAKRQRHVINSVMNMDGYCVYEYEYLQTHTSPYPQWLLRLSGDDFFHSIAEVHFPDYQPHERYGEFRLSNERLALLEDLANLRCLLIREPQITDEAVPYIVRFRGLRYLNIYGSSISDVGVERLRKQLPGIEVSRERLTGQVIGPVE